MREPSSILSIAIPAPLFTLFDYLAPPHVDGKHLQPGIRIRVPFAKGEKLGILIEIKNQSQVANGKLKTATEIIDAQPVLSKEIFDLCVWLSDYYHHPLGECFFSALPSAMRNLASRPTPQIRWRVTEAGKKQAHEHATRSAKQWRIIQLLLTQESGMAQAQLSKVVPQPYSALAALAKKTWIERFEDDTRRHDMLPDSTVEPPRYSLNPAQKQAKMEILASLQTFVAWLLYGVTGSGKTEVYLQIIDKTLSMGRQILVLVPEIGLTPQLLKRFQVRLDAPLLCFHSGMSNQQRLSAWQQAQQDRACVVIGTRSSVFMPLPNLGLIIVDEEHDMSYKQQDGLRYHARDVALVRAKRKNIPIVLGSATPSLESMHHAHTGKYQLLSLPERAGCAIHPRMRLLDVRGQSMQHGLSVQLIQRIREHLQQDGQVLLFLNRRGFAPTLMCHSCGWIAQCKRCDAHLTLHVGDQRLRCHHCGSTQRVPSACPQCTEPTLLRLGVGTQRTEQALQDAFPQQTILRIDRDSTRAKGAMEAKLEQAQQGRSQLLIGTQLLAKGHHFPNVTLVAIVDTDQQLFSSDFRASERLAQLILQVAGRAGRAEKPGEVLIQTHHPDSVLLHTLLQQDYARFAAEALAERKLTEFPPYCYLVLIRAEATEREAPLVFLHQFVEQSKRLRAREIDIMGPVPAPMERRAGRFRAQLLFQCKQRKPLHQHLSTLIEHIQRLKSARKVRWSIDVDPMDLY